MRVEQTQQGGGGGRGGLARCVEARVGVMIAAMSSGESGGEATGLATRFVTKNAMVDCCTVCASGTYTGGRTYTVRPRARVSCVCEKREQRAEDCAVHTQEGAGSTADIELATVNGAVIG